MLHFHFSTSMSVAALLGRQFPLRPSNVFAPHRLFTVTRAFRSSVPCLDFHFDTHHFVQRLESEGLNRAQAEGIMSAMAEVIDESIRNMTSNMVTKAEQEKVRASITHCDFLLST